MPRITERDLTALKQKRVVINRISGKARFDRQSTDGDPDCIQFDAIDESKTGSPGRKSAKQADESRSKKQNANRDPHRVRPSRDQMGPQKRQNKEVGPNHDLEIVPPPWRHSDKESQDENCDGRPE